MGSVLFLLGVEVLWTRGMDFWEAFKLLILLFLTIFLRNHLLYYYLMFLIFFKCCLLITCVNSLDPGTVQTLSCPQSGAQWLSGRVLDPRPRGCMFEPHRRHCVMPLSKTH